MNYKPIVRYFIKTLTFLFFSIIALKIVIELVYVKTTNLESLLLSGDLMPIVFILIASVFIATFITYRKYKQNLTK